MSHSAFTPRECILKKSIAWALLPKEKKHTHRHTHTHIVSKKISGKAKTSHVTSRKTTTIAAWPRCTILVRLHSLPARSHHNVQYIYSRSSPQWNTVQPPGWEIYLEASRVKRSRLDTRPLRARVFPQRDRSQFFLLLLLAHPARSGDALGPPMSQYRCTTRRWGPLSSRVRSEGVDNSSLYHVVSLMVGYKAGRLFVHTCLMKGYWYKKMWHPAVTNGIAIRSIFA